MPEKKYKYEVEPNSVFCCLFNVGIVSLGGQIWGQNQWFETKWGWAKLSEYQKNYGNKVIWVCINCFQTAT